MLIANRRAGERLVLGMQDGREVVLDVMSTRVVGSRATATIGLDGPVHAVTWEVGGARGAPPDAIDLEQDTPVAIFTDAGTDPILLTLRSPAGADGAAIGVSAPASIRVFRAESRPA